MQRETDSLSGGTVPVVANGGSGTQPGPCLRKAPHSAFNFTVAGIDVRCGRRPLPCQKVLPVNRRPILTPRRYGRKSLSDRRVFRKKVGSRLDADQILLKSTIPLLFQPFIAQLGWGQSWTPIHTVLSRGLRAVAPSRCRGAQRADSGGLAAVLRLRGPSGGPKSAGWGELPVPVASRCRRAPRARQGRSTAFLPRRVVAACLVAGALNARVPHRYQIPRARKSWT